MSAFKLDGPWKANDSASGWFIDVWLAGERIATFHGTSSELARQRAFDYVEKCQGARVGFQS